ncbi:ImmA/IrrE family metallo-endopeptidase [Flavobacterium hauense]
MKSIRIILVLAAWCCMLPAWAQKTFGSDKYTAMCNYYGETTAKAIYMSPAGASANKVVEDIMSVIGLRANFELRASTDIPTAAAVIKKGSRYILYNPTFMNSIISATGNRWTAVSIMAHEIGHHLSGHTLDSETSKPATELEADEFSGFVLQKMGATLTDAQAAMAAIASLKGSHSHPPKNQRLSAIATGWGKAGGKTITTAVAAYQPEQPKTITAAPITLQPQRTETKPLTRAEKISQSAKSDKNVVSEAWFASDPNGKYYVTAKGNLVQVDRDKVYLVGSLTQSNKPGYKMMLTDTDYNTIYVGSGGMLVNNYGKKIGYLKARK